MSLAQNNFGREISINLSGKYSQKFIDHAKHSVTDVFKTASKKAIQNAVEATCYLIRNKIAKRITKVSKNLEKVPSENDGEIHEER